MLDESKVGLGPPARPTSRSTINRTTTAAGVYPIILHLVPDHLPEAEASQGAADLIKAFETYVVSSEGQQAAAAAAGSAPLSDSLAAKAQTAIDTITAK